MPCLDVLTAARLDRDAGLDRDLGTIATVLHQEAGLPVDRGITRAQATLRLGETEGWVQALALSDVPSMFSYVPPGNVTLDIPTPKM